MNSDEIKLSLINPFPKYIEPAIPIIIKIGNLY